METLRYKSIATCHSTYKEYIQALQLIDLYA